MVGCHVQKLVRSAQLLNIERVKRLQPYQPKFFMKWQRHLYLNELEKPTSRFCRLVDTICCDGQRVLSLIAKLSDLKKTVSRLLHLSRVVSITAEARSEAGSLNLRMGEDRDQRG